MTCTKCRTLSVYMCVAHHSLIHIASGPDDRRGFRRHVQVCVDSSTLSVVLAGFETTHVYTLYTMYLCFVALESHHSFSRSQVTCSMASYEDPSYEPSVLWDKVRYKFESNMRMDLLGMDGTQRRR